MKENSLLILGGSGVEDHDGKICAKGAFSDYLEGLSFEFDKVTWLTSKYEGENFKIPLTSKVGLIALDNKGMLPFSRLVSKTFLKHYRDYQYILIFLPFGVYLTPVVSLRSFFKFSYVSYVGTNFRDHKIDKEKKGKSEIWKRLFEYVIKSSTHVIARGKFLKRLSNKLHDKITITLPLGNRPPQDLDLISPEIRFSAKKIIFIGVVKKSKGLQVLIQALNELEIPNIQLAVVGNGPDIEALKLIAEQANFVETKFLGWLDDRNQISSLINQSTILVCPSLEPFEGVPRVIDEAIMHKVPVIATKMGGIDMEFSTEEIWKTDGTQEQLVQALKQMLTNRTEYDKFVKGLEERHDWLTENKSVAHQHAVIIKQKSN